MMVCGEIGIAVSDDDFANKALTQQSCHQPPL
jgi:hypothetical protein